MMDFSLKSEVFTGALTKILEELAGQNYKNILLVTSPTISKIDIVDYLITCLKKQYVLDIFSNIRPDAPIDILDKIQGDFSKPDVIIGIGGGSVLDSAKALKYAWTNNTITDFFYGRKKLPEESIDLYVVPTTAGTGAELSFGAILYDVKNKVKSGLRSSKLLPNKVFICPELYEHAPKKLKAETGFDCFTHAMETYLSKASNPIVKNNSISAILCIVKNLERAVEGDLECMGKMAIVSAMMGINLAYSSTCLPHRIQYVIGPLTQTSHAQGLIALYSGWLEKVVFTEQFAQLNRELHFYGVDILQWTYDIKNKLGINYNLTEFGIHANQLEWIAEKTTGNLQQDPCYQDKNTIIEILEKSL